MTLPAEDLLLLLLDDESGKLSGTTSPGTALGGALLVELALGGAVVVEEKRRAWHSAKVSPVTGVEVSDPMLVAALATVAEKPRTAQDLVGRLGKDALPRLADALVARGILERREDRLLGIFPRRRWPAVDSSHETQVRQRLADILVRGLTPDERTGALIALLSALDRAPAAVESDGLSKREIRKRAKEIAQGNWAAAAVRDALNAASAATIAAMSAAGAASVASGS